MIRRISKAIVLTLVGLPLVVAFLGPLLAGNGTEIVGQPFTFDSGWPGTDHIGRSVLDGLLQGGWSIVLIATAATATGYLVGAPLGIAAASTRHRLLDEALMRPLDLVLAIPSLLLMLLLASIATPGPIAVIAIVALINVPDVARIARAAALEVAHRPAVEALWLQGESRIRITIGYIARSTMPVLATDAGVRVVGAFYLVAAASFLGVGTGRETGDWAVMVDLNRTGMFLSPWGIVLPAAMLVALSAGLNLLFDDLLARQRSKEDT